MTIEEKKLTETQYRKLAKIVYEESGVVLSDKKYRLLVARLAKRMRVKKITVVSEYIALLENSPDEFTAFIDATTTNHTYFFRENKHCDYLLGHCDPSKPLKIWSAASSSGEEAFTIAIQLMANGFSFSIDASDISGAMLDIARKGVYPMDRVRNVPDAMLRTYFQKGKNQFHDHVRVKPEVRQHVFFKKFNLLSDTASEKYDIIFCRNVMIYFDQPTRQNVVSRLCAALKPGGVFFVGMAENLHGIDHPLRPVIPSGYKK